MPSVPMEQRTSACPLDCPDLCGLSVTVDNGRVVEVDGDRRGPITDALIPQGVADLGGQAVFNDARVQVALS